MKKYYVIFNNETAFWCWQEEAFEKEATGWKLHAIANDEKTADIYCEEACYV